MLSHGSFNIHNGLADLVDRWINDTDNWIYDEEDTDRPMLCGNLTGARHCPTGDYLPLFIATLIYLPDVSVRVCAITRKPSANVEKSMKTADLP